MYHKIASHYARTVHASVFFVVHFLLKEMFY